MSETLPRVVPSQVRKRLRQGDEFAFLDVREEGPFSRAQPLFAVNLPLSRVEERAFRLLPRRSVPIVLFDGGAGLALRAGRRLRALGYGDVAVVEGGLAEWRAAGGELFRDVGVPSKAFGEVLEAQAHTPGISAAELKALQDRGADVVVLDSRPFAEYRVMTIPGSISCPGAELVLRAKELVRSSETLVVVNCAGRTRSLVGAQSLVNSGLFPRVAALRNGTIGWLLAGFELEFGATRRAPDTVTPSHRTAAAQAARALAERTGVRFLSESEAAAWEQDDSRTLFRFDVRGPEEAAISHAPGFASAPGGQLVQATDEYVGVQGARLLLADDDDVRAAMTASWLRQLGWEQVAVLDSGLGHRLVSGPPPAPPLPARPVVPSITVADLKAAEGRATVLDLARSPDYRHGHIPGAWFAIRASLAEALPALPRTPLVVLTSPDGLLAALAQAEAQALTSRQVVALEGGTEAWRAAGFAVESGAGSYAVPPDDVYKRPYEGTDSPRSAMQGYLDWEFGLVEQIANDGTARYAVARPPEQGSAP